MKKPRPPHAPYCLCGSLWRWVLQLVSPYLYSKYYFSGENRRANAYFAKVRDYYTKLEARYPDGFSADRSLHRAKNDV